MRKGLPGPLQLFARLRRMEVGRPNVSEGRTWDIAIRNALLAEDGSPVDIGIAGGEVAAIEPALSGHAIRTVDALGNLVTCSFTEPHFHLDKVLSRGHFGALRFEQAFEKAHEVKQHFTVADVEERASRALELAVAHGIGCMRAQIDVDYATGLVSFEGVARAAERFKDAIDVQLTAFPQEGIVTDPKAPDLLREAIGMGATVIGGLPEFEHSVQDQVTHVRTIFDIAEKTGVIVDMHADYQDAAEFKTLEMMADETIARGLQGQVVANHCNALSMYDDDEAARVIDKLVEAEMQIAVLPVANLQMLGGPKRTPYNRASSRIKELMDAGINVAAGADNMFDIWFRFSRMDPVEVGYIACLSGGMRTDDEVRYAFEMVTSRAARYVGKTGDDVAVGSKADLVVHAAANIVDIFRNLPGRRVHIKNGRIVGGIEGNHWCAA